MAIIDTPLNKNENQENTNKINSKITDNDEAKKAIEKTFKYFDPLSPKLASELNKKAGREFNTHFTNQLLKKFIKLYPNKVFANHYCFYAYMIKALRYEKHQAPLVNHETFYLSVNISEEQKEINRKNKYLAKIESSACTTPTALLEKKIASKFETNLAYSLLNECQFEMQQEYELDKSHEQFEEIFKGMREASDSDIKIALEAQKLLAKYAQEYKEEVTNINEIGLSKAYPFKEFTAIELKELKKRYKLGKDNIITQKGKNLEEMEQIDSVILYNVMVVSLSKTITLTDLDRKLLENEIKAVYGDINVIYKQLKGRVTNYNNNSKEIKTHKEEQEYSPLWQKIRAELKGYFGEAWSALDNAWFSKLEAKINENTGNVVINTPNAFFRDWITNHYLSLLEESCKALNLKLSRSRFELVTVNNH